MIKTAAERAQDLGLPVWHIELRDAGYEGTSLELDALIEACPPSMPHPFTQTETPFVLVSGPNDAIAGYGLTQIANIKGQGTGPDRRREAVARLWLALPPELQLGEKEKTCPTT